MILSGVAEGIPYSVSRWTDVPAGKWTWFESCLSARQMVAIHPGSAAPSIWSLRPEETLSLVFWTKNPSSLIASQLRLEPYNVVVHLTATGWSEVEQGAPGLEESGRLLIETAKAFGTVRWRFSPIPMLSNIVVIERFLRLLDYAAQAQLREVFVSFLQPNDRMLESRGSLHRFYLLNCLAEKAASFGIAVRLCQDDHMFDDLAYAAQFSLMPCVRVDDFPPGKLNQDNCGCVRMADPFSVNEACPYRCQYCYAADRSLSARKRRTIRRPPSLEIVR